MKRYHFYILYGANNYNAINAEIYKRAEGTDDLGLPTYLHLINCSPDYVAFVKYQLFKHNENNKISLVIQSEDEFLESIVNMDIENDIIIGNSYMGLNYWKWIKIAEKILSIHPLIIVEDYPLVFDRYQNIDFKNKIVINKLLIWLSYLIKPRVTSVYRQSACLIANSEVTRDFIKSKFHIFPHFISYPPIHEEYFHFITNNRDSILLHYSKNIDNDLIEGIAKFAKLMKFKIIILNGPRIPELENLAPKYLNKYSFEELKVAYSKSVFSVITEKYGTFEGPPIESIASGVPVIGAKVSSIEFIKNILGNYIEKAFLELNNNDFDCNKIRDWLHSITDEDRRYMSSIVSHYFSQVNIQRMFINEIEKCLNNYRNQNYISYFEINHDELY